MCQGVEAHIRFFLDHYLLPARQVSTSTTSLIFSINKIKPSSYIFYCAYIYYIILYIYAEFHLHELRGNHVSGDNKGDEFDSNSNQHIMEKTVTKLAWTPAMDCTTKTYTMMMETFIDIRKVPQRHLYVISDLSSDYIRLYMKHIFISII